VPARGFWCYATGTTWTNGSDVVRKGSKFWHLAGQLNVLIRIKRGNARSTFQSF